MTEATIEANRLATVFGGSGFLGRHIVRALARKGWRIRVAVRRPDLAAFLTPLGGVGQIQPVQANVRFPDSIAAALEGATAAINVTGVKAESGAQTYQSRACRRRARAGARGVEAPASRPMSISPGSALTRNPLRPISPARDWASEATRDAFPNAIVMRPSVVFGPEDDFFNRFGALACHLPVLPSVGGRQDSPPAGLCRRSRAGRGGGALRTGENRRDLRARRSADDDAARSGRADAARD